MAFIINNSRWAINHKYLTPEPPLKFTDRDSSSKQISFSYSYIYSSLGTVPTVSGLTSTTIRCSRRSTCLQELDITSSSSFPSSSTPQWSFHPRYLSLSNNQLALDVVQRKWDWFGSEKVLHHRETLLKLHFQIERPVRSEESPGQTEVHPLRTTLFLSLTYLSIAFILLLI